MTLGGCATCLSPSLPRSETELTMPSESGGPGSEQTPGGVGELVLWLMLQVSLVFYPVHRGHMGSLNLTLNPLKP